MNKIQKFTKKAIVKIMLKNIEYWKDAPVWTPESIEKETKSWFKYLK